MDSCHTGVSQQRASGKAVVPQQRNHNSDSYYRWERGLLALTGGTRSKLHPASPTTFAELPAPQQLCRTVSERSATVRINAFTIDIYPGMDAKLLKTLLDAARVC